MGNVKYRIRATGQLDLPREGFDAFFLRHKVYADLRQGCVRFPPFLAARSVKTAASLATRRPRAIGARSALSLRAAGSALPTARLVRPFAPALVAFTFSRAGCALAAFIFGIAIGVGRLPGPGGQELQLQVFQIQTDIRRFAHVTASTARHYAPRTEWTVRMNPRVVECKRRVRDSGQRGGSLRFGL